MTLFIQPWLASYLDGVFARRGDAVLPTRMAVQFADGDRPQIACCHDNVDRWVRENPDCEAIRGWAITAACGGSIMLAAHSVVRSASGDLIDITPMLTDWPVAVIAHVGSEVEFSAARSIVNNLVWPLSA